MITKKDVEHLLKLARLKLSLKEKEKIIQDLDRILEYVTQLKKVNTDKSEPLSGGTLLLRNIFREDIEGEKDENFTLSFLAQAYDTENRFFKIPPIF